MQENPDEMVEIRRVANEMIAGMLVGRLREEGIEAEHFNYDSVALGAFGATGFMPRSVMVRRADAERANVALERMREESLDIDWDEVDVGEPEDRLAKKIAERGEGERIGFPLILKVGLIAAVLVAVYAVLSNFGKQP